jgi:hypothetical protein
MKPLKKDTLHRLQFIKHVGGSNLFTEPDVQYVVKGDLSAQLSYMACNAPWFRSTELSSYVTH